MRTLFLAFAAFLCGTLTLSAQADENGHVLTTLWKQYEDAVKADRPVKEAEILAAIKTEAMQRHLPVDFYDAATEYVETVVRRDWKQRSALRQALAEEVKAFDEPIVTFLWMSEYNSSGTDALWAYVKAHPDGFNGRNPAFYKRVSDHIGGAMLPYIESDKEYVLWRLLPYRSYSTTGQFEIYDALKSIVKGRYPNEFCLEYAMLPTDRTRIGKVRPLYERWKDKAVGFYPLAELLSDEFSDLERKKADASAFKEFYNRCASFEKKRSALKGEEARIAASARGIKDICETLVSKNLEISITEQRHITVRFRNLGDAVMVLMKTDSDTPLQRWNLKNPTRSFYVYDTVSVDLPVIADGDYRLSVSKDKISDDCYYSSHTLSLAVRKIAGNWNIYVTDFKSGEPLSGTVKTTLTEGADCIGTAELTLSPEGFTPIPASLQQKIGAKSSATYSLRVESGMRASYEVELYEPYYYKPYKSMRGRIYRDRGAYNPGDRMQFKVILYEGDPVGGYTVLPDQALRVVLSNSEGKDLETLSLTTGQFGSADGAFVLPKGQRNGLFSLSVRTAGGRHVASDSFRVDEFVLPTFILDFDSHDELYLPGNDIPVSGRLTSYSGHPLKGAKIRLLVERWGGLVEDVEIKPAADNTFSYSFQAPGEGFYSITAQVTDATGEMQEFRYGVFVTGDINLSVSVENAAEGQFSLAGEEVATPIRYNRRYTPYYPYHRDSKYLLTDTLSMSVLAKVTNTEGTQVPMDVHYKLYRLAKDTTLVMQGVCYSGVVKDIPVRSLSEGLYKLEASCRIMHEDGTRVRASAKTNAYILKLMDGTPLTPRVASVFVSSPATVGADGKIRLGLGAADGAQWTVVSLFGEEEQCLQSRLVSTADREMGCIEWEYEDSYPDAVRLVAFAFKDGRAITYDREFRRGKTKLDLPLSFTRFEDKTAPGTSYTFTLKTDPAVEALVAIWDKAIDAISTNDWELVSTRDYSAPSVSTLNEPGLITTIGYGSEMLYDEAPLLMESRAAKAGGAMDFAANEEASSDGPVIREAFETALCFEPHLLPDSDGNLSFSFRTSDKLSTYYVSVLVHDRTMRNAIVRQETVVSLPLKVSIVEPSCLYEGDTWEAAVTLTNMSGKKLSGTLQFTAGYEDDTPFVKRTQVANVPADGDVTVVFPIKNLSLRGRSEGSLQVTATFSAKDLSDGVRVAVPVHRASQLLTESHSALLQAGQDREALLKELRGRFENIDGAKADVREITILDMVKDAIPGKVNPSGKDVLALSEAWYMRLLSGRLLGRQMETDDLLEKILACRNSDGGFGWFEGMRSSPTITAVLLERMAKLRDRGFEEVPDLSSSAAYLDHVHFDQSRAGWYDGLTDAQYMRVRAMYPSVAFAWKASTRKEKEAFDKFRERTEAYLTPSEEEGRGLKGAILRKARRLITLRDLAADKGGVALAAAWGIGGNTQARLTASMEADLLSLSEYAVTHRDGGWYFPNAVMPWRGLLESEAYAHSLLCDLFSEAGMRGHGKHAFQATDYVSVIPASAAHLSDGIRLWLMIQKETQHWDAEPAFVDAIVSILDGTGDFLETRVMVLSATFDAPFKEVKASGNGFTISRHFYRDGEEIRPGTPVKVGDKIVAEYRIHNDENRSFVRLTAGREGTFRPVDQISGYTGWRIRPLRDGYAIGFMPQGYRNVKATETEYFFDVYPEEDTVVSEEMFVTEAGVFRAPLVTIESLYATHYRANDAYKGALNVTR